MRMLNKIGLAGPNQMFLGNILTLSCARSVMSCRMHGLIIMKSIVEFCMLCLLTIIPLSGLCSFDIIFNVAATSLRCLNASAIACIRRLLAKVHCDYYYYLVITVAAQEDPGIVIAHPGQDVELLCTVTVTDSGSQGVGWLINNSMGPYRINAIRGGILARHTATLGSNNLIVENITMNDDRNGSDYRCVIVPAQGTASLGDIIDESDPTILYVAGE